MSCLQPVSIFPRTRADSVCLTQFTTAKTIYKDFTTTFPLPKIMDKYELQWDPVLEPPIQSLMFLLVHNILPVKSRLHRLNLVNTDRCKEDNMLEDVEHVFCHCVKSRAGWQWVKYKITNDFIPVGYPVPSDFELLNLCYESPHAKEVLWIVANYVQLAWTTFQKSQGYIDVDLLKTNLQHLYKLNQNSQNKLGIIMW